MQKNLLYEEETAIQSICSHMSVHKASQFAPLFFY